MKKIINIHIHTHTHTHCHGNANCLLYKILIKNEEKKTAATTK